AVGFDAAQRLGLDLDAAGQRRAVERGRGVHADIDVRRAGRDLDIVAVAAAVHLADVQVGALLGDGLGHDADDNLADFGPEVDAFLDLEPAGEELFFKLLRGYIDIDVTFEPTERYFHGVSPPLLLLELAQEAQVVLEHQADVVDAVLEHRDALKPDAERKAGVDFRVDAAVAQHVVVHHA